MLANVMYILPMLLGRTFDARHDRVGIDIFPQSELDRNKTLWEPESVSRYETTDSAEEVRALLEVSADLALKVKAGKLDAKGSGSYLRDTNKLGRVIEILTRLKFKTVSVALPSDVRPFPSWATRSRADLGTHYVRSVTYGGELLASVRFRANRDADFAAVSAEVSANFHGGDATSLVAEGKLESVQSRLKDKANMEISYYATVPLKGVPNTIDGLRHLVSNFSKQVEQVNDGLGVPIRVELVELATLGGANASEFKFLKDSALESELADVEHEFDDLRKASSMLTEWYRSLPPSVTPQQEEEINKLYSRIQKILRPYYDSIGKLNIEEGPEKQVKAAREAYREGKISSLPGKFTKDFMRLKKKIVVVEKRLYGTGTVVLTRWGRSACPASPMTHRLHEGVVAATTNRGTGGSSDYICAPTDQEGGDEAIETELRGSETSALLSAAKWSNLDEHPFSSPDARYFFGKGVRCALCHLTNRTLVHVFPSQSLCPPDWIHEYSGFLMSGSNLPGDLLCVDEDPEATNRQTDEQQAPLLALVHVSDKDGGLGKPPYVPTAAVACAVCSK